MIYLEKVDDIKEIKSLLWFPPNETHIWVRVVFDTHIVGVLELQPITTVTANLHLHIFKQFQKSGIASHLAAALDRFAVENGITTFLAMVPEQNHKVESALIANDFLRISLIPNGIIYNNTVQNLIIYSRSVLFS